MASAARVLLTGATGYVGGRLLPGLEARGLGLRCLARRPQVLTGRVGPGTEVVGGDVFDGESLARAMAGIHTAYYLVHSMEAGPAYAELDNRAAELFGRCAHQAGVRRIIYLGGLASTGEVLSRHLRSRLETGERLCASGVPVVEFRASIVIGSGSLSFEVIRSLVERLPIMVWPRWVRTLAQPIAIDDLVAYLLAALDLPDSDGSQVYEIGGGDTASYGELMREYARQRGLRRLMIPVPFLTPGLSSKWLGLVTPVYARVGRELIHGVRNPTIVRDARARQVFPIRPMDHRAAMARALAEPAQSSWIDARSVAPKVPGTPGISTGRRLVDRREVLVDASPAAAFAPIQRLGGANGWYFGNLLWRLRGWIDLLLGGVGLRRGRRHPVQLRTGDALDFWRVESFEPDKRLRLAAEMRLPGMAWLEFEVTPVEGGCRIRQEALFIPSGVGGLAYWYLLLPIHWVIFGGMLRGVARRIPGSRPDGSGGPQPIGAERNKTSQPNQDNRT